MLGQLNKRLKKNYIIVYRYKYILIHIDNLYDA